MSRQECRCTLTLAELGAPTDRETAQAWAQLNGVDVVVDYADRLAVSVESAYKVAENRRVAQAAAEAWAEEAQDLLNRVHAADRERVDILEAAVTRFMAGGRNTTGGIDLRYPAAYKQALREVAKFDRTLPGEVRERLGVLPQWVGWESEDGSK
jgi:hypothetical protein